MKLVYGPQVYDQLPPEDRAKLTAVSCECVTNDVPNPDCDQCEGRGSLYEDTTVDPDTMREIMNNLRSQGIPFGKSGTS